MHTHVRSNPDLELAVRYGIVLDEQLGAVHAWTFMANNGVHRSVILRVLLDVEKRRSTDQLATDTPIQPGLLNRQAEAIHFIAGLQLAGSTSKT